MATAALITIGILFTSAMIYFVYRLAKLSH